MPLEMADLETVKLESNMASQSQPITGFEHVSFKTKKLLCFEKKLQTILFFQQDIQKKLCALAEVSLENLETGMDSQGNAPPNSPESLANQVKEVMNL